MTTLLSDGHAEQLLAQLVYARVRQHIDLDSLEHLEQDFALEIGKLADLTTAEMAAMSRALIDRALERLASDADRYRIWTEQDSELLIRYKSWLRETRGDQKPVSNGAPS